jgi:protein-tyrosine phosphatase
VAPVGLGTVETVSGVQWIELAGAANVRDLGGLPTTEGRVVAAHRLVRADNLQGLTPADVRCLLDDIGVRAVADLRTGVEVAHEGPGPLTREPAVAIEHLSLFPEVGHNTDAAALDDDGGPVLLPWQTRDADLDPGARRAAAGVYANYLNDRPDSIIAALRLIACTDGATIVHCAAGKDRTGVVVALALAEVGVGPEEIVADYVATAQRIEAVFARLTASPTYAVDMDHWDPSRHVPRAETMQRLLDELDTDFGGPGGWLRKNGWTEADAVALRERLLANP